MLKYLFWGIDNVDLNLEDRGIDNVGLNLEDRIDNVGLNLADLEQFILNDNSNKIFYGKGNRTIVICGWTSIFSSKIWQKPIFHFSCKMFRYTFPKRRRRCTLRVFEQIIYNWYLQRWLLVDCLYIYSQSLEKSSICCLWQCTQWHMYTISWCDRFSRDHTQNTFFRLFRASRNKDYFQRSYIYI